MLKWPTRATQALRLLFEPLQPIDIYIEDTNDEAFYQRLLNRASGGKVEIARVFALGGRPAVIEAAERHDFTKRKALFIVDGDIYWTKGLPKPKVTGLHVHNAYCIENLLICEQAIAAILAEELVEPESEVVKKFNYTRWHQFTSTHLGELFAAIAVLHDINPTLPTVARGINILCTLRRKGVFPVLDPTAVAKEKDYLLNLAESYSSKHRADTLFDKYKDRIQLLSNPLDAVSGKTHLLPLIDFTLQSLGCRIPRKTLRMRLASSTPIEKFAEISNAIVKSAKFA